MVRRILVVDDNLDAATTLARILRLDGHEVDVAHDGAAALSSARRLRPEFVFLDIGLPGMDGFQVAESLRREPGLERMKVIAVTGSASEDDRRRLRDAGVDYYLVKPVDMDLVVSLVGGRPSTWRGRFRPPNPDRR
jgi:DNA-binding response OmpR family regulator